MALHELLKDHLDHIPSTEVPSPATREEMPVLDLVGGKPTGADLVRLGKEMRKACLGIGFFYVKNHGVSKPALDNLFGALKRYFDLPLEEKQKTKVEGKLLRGFTVQGVNQHPGYAPDIKDSFEFGVDLAPTHPDVANKVPLHGPNKWPADQPWLREAAEPYSRQVNDLGHQLLRIFSVSLDLEPDYLEQFFKDPTLATTKLFYYPPQDASSRGDAYGVAPHTDYGAITILAQDPIGGLEVKTRDGRWAGAPYIDGTLVINLGDLFRLWTNDVYVSNPHRVVNRTGKKRYSIPTFFNPNYHAMISCIPTCQSPENPPKYAPISAGDYMMSRYKSTQKI